MTYLSPSYYIFAFIRVTNFAFTVKCYGVKYD